MDVPISGVCAPGYEAVQDEFAANFAERGEVGAALCVIVDGETVVDLVGGWSDAARTTPWTPRTIVDFYSVGKAIIALLALQAVDGGRVGLDDPIATIWPEFAAHGKSLGALSEKVSSLADLERALAALNSTREKASI